MRFRLLTCVLAAAWLLVLAQAASAADFYAASAGEVEGAILAANSNPGPDTVHVAAGTYPIGPSTFPQLSADPGNPITIVGAGRGRTILTASTAAGAGYASALKLQLPTSTSAMSGFTLNATAAHSTAAALWLVRGSLRDFELNFAQGTPTQSQLHGLIVDADATGASITDGQFKTPSGSLIYGAVVDADDAVLSNLVLHGEGGTGITLRSDGATVSRVNVSGFAFAVRLTGGDNVLRDSLLDLGTTDFAYGIHGWDAGSGTTHARLDVSRVTIVGAGLVQSGLSSNGASAGKTMAFSLKDLVIYHTVSGSNFNAVDCRFDLGGGTLLIENVAHNGAILFDPLCPREGTPTFSELTASPFVDAAAGNFRPLPGGPLIDAGVTTAAAAAEGASLDVGGGSRIVDGNGDGSAIVDIGAFEHQVPPPVEPGESACPAVISRVLTKVKKPKKSFRRVGRKGTSFKLTKSKKQPQVSFRSPAKRNFKLTLERRGKGKKAKFKALKGSQTLRVKKGTNRLVFGGRWSKKRLKAGSYRVALSPSKQSTSCNNERGFVLKFKLK